MKLKQPLTDVQLAEDKNDVFICPANCANGILLFFNAYGIPYTVIENPKLYPADEIDRQLSKYIEPLWMPDDLNEIKEAYGFTAIICKFNSDALFDWAMQILSMDCDPEYQKYLDQKRKEAEEYYEKYVKE